MCSVKKSYTNNIHYTHGTCREQDKFWSLYGNLKIKKVENINNHLIYIYIDRFMFCLSIDKFPSYIYIPSVKYDYHNTERMGCWQLVIQTLYAKLRPFSNFCKYCDWFRKQGFFMNHFASQTANPYDRCIQPHHWLPVGSGLGVKLETAITIFIKHFNTLKPREMVAILQTTVSPIKVLFSIKIFLMIHSKGQ